MRSSVSRCFGNTPACRALKPHWAAQLKTKLPDRFYGLFVNHSDYLHKLFWTHCNGYIKKSGAAPWPLKPISCTPQLFYTSIWKPDAHWSVLDSPEQIPTLFIWRLCHNGQRLLFYGMLECQWPAMQMDGSVLVGCGETILQVPLNGTANLRQLCPDLMRSARMKRNFNQIMVT